MSSVRIAIAVAVGGVLARSFVPSGADQSVHVGLHQQLHYGLGHATQKSPSPALANSSASGSLSSVIGFSRREDKASQLHLSQPIRWPLNPGLTWASTLRSAPPPFGTKPTSAITNFHHDVGRYILKIQERRKTEVPGTFTLALST